MICESYNKLNLPEKWIFSGELLHAVSNDEGLFNEACEIINKALKMGIMDKVVILPMPKQNDKIDY